MTALVAGPIKLGPDHAGDGAAPAVSPAIVEGSPQRIAGRLTGRVQGPGTPAGLTVTGDPGQLPRWL